MKKKKYTQAQKARLMYLIAQNPNLSVRDLEKMTGVPRSTIHRWITEAKKEKRTGKIEKLYYKMSEDFKERIINSLLNVVSAKGKTRAAVNKKFLFEIFELDFREIGVNDYKTASEVISYLVKQEFGSWEKLEMKRRPFKEHSLYRASKGKLHRKPALLEIDGTGLSFEIEEGKEKIQISLFLAIDSYSGYIFPLPLLIENRTKQVRFYNRAFNSREVAKFLMELFVEYGLPKQIRTDNDPTIKNEYLNEAFKALEIEAIKAKRPNQKLIERIIEDFKKRARYYQATNKPQTREEIHQTVLQAIKACNSMERKFEIFNKTHTAEEVFMAIQDEYRHIEEEKARRAFMEVKEATVRNNRIDWDGYVYQFLMTGTVREGEYGRRPKAPRVLVKRHIDNASFLEVYSLETGEYLGEARLISSDVPTINPIERQQIKSAEKRAEKKAKKLTEEINQINQEVEKVKEEIYQSNVIPEIKLEEENAPSLSVWEILNKGGLKDD